MILVVADRGKTLVADGKTYDEVTANRTPPRSSTSTGATPRDS